MKYFNLILGKDENTNIFKAVKKSNENLEGEIAKSKNYDNDYFLTIILMI